MTGKMNLLGNWKMFEHGVLEPAQGISFLIFNRGMGLGTGMGMGMGMATALG